MQKIIISGLIAFVGFGFYKAYSGSDIVAVNPEREVAAVTNSVKDEVISAVATATAEEVEEVKEVKETVMHSSLSDFLAGDNSSQSPLATASSYEDYSETELESELVKIYEQNPDLFTPENLVEILSEHGIDEEYLEAMCRVIE